MRRLLCLLPCAFLLSGCLALLQAQSLPLTLRAQWDPPPAADNITNFLVSLDGAPQVSVPATVSPACTCVEWSFPVATATDHVVTVVAQNLALSTDPNSKQSSAPTIVPFRVNLAPGAIKNGKVIK